MPGNRHVRFGGAAPGNPPRKRDTAPGADPNHDGGWNIEVLGLGHYRWTNPNRRTYTVEPEPVVEPPRVTQPPTPPPVPPPDDDPPPF
jgi:hypothetical protein